MGTLFCSLTGLAVTDLAVSTRREHFQQCSRCPGLTRHARVNQHASWAQHHFTSNGAEGRPYSAPPDDVKKSQALLFVLHVFPARLTGWASSPMKCYSNSVLLPDHGDTNHGNRKIIIIIKNKIYIYINFSLLSLSLRSLQTAADHSLCGTRSASAFTS